MIRAPAILLLGVAAWLPASTVAGDWIVMRDGTRVETRGAWQVKGRQVVFTRPDGSLSSLRETDVDLEASAAATSEAAERAVAEPAAAPAPEGRPRPPVLVLTNADLPSREAVPEEDVEDEGEAQDQAVPDEPEEVAAEPVEVVSWEERDTGDASGLEVHGRVRNSGQRVAAEIEVTVTVAGEAGEPPVRALAFLGSRALAPGAATTFRALLPGIFGLVGEPAFEVRSEAFDIGGRPAAGEDGPGEAGNLEEAEDLESGGDSDRPSEPR